MQITRHKGFEVYNRIKCKNSNPNPEDLNKLVNELDKIISKMNEKPNLAPDPNNSLKPRIK